MAQHLFDNTHCIIINNSRLDYKDCYRVVSKFVHDRLRYSGINSILTARNKDEADLLINEMSQTTNNFIIVCDIMNPFLDIDLAAKMISRLSDSDLNICVSDGAIPGTQP